MDDKQEKLLQELEVRMRQLMYLCDSLREDNMQLRNELYEKEKKTKNLTADLADIQSKYTNLKMTKSFATNNREDVENAKAKLSKLVQDVEKCISLLKQ